MIELKKCENCYEKCLENTLKKSHGYLMCANCIDEARKIDQEENGVYESYDESYNLI